jgi:Asp-tRNA(Asn)/Glu-tRNA(Gln) amidotransferase C subunit
VNSNIQDYSEEIKQFEILKLQYQQALENYQNDVREYEKNDSVSLQERKLINEFKKDAIAFKVITESLDEKLQINETIDNAIVQVQTEKEFRELIREVSIEEANSNRYLKKSTNALQLTLHKIVEAESWGLLSLALNKTIEQYSDEETKQQIIEQVDIILDSVNKIKDIDTGDDLPDTGDDLPDTGDDLPDTGDDLPDTGDDLPDTGDDCSL